MSCFGLVIWLRLVLRPEASDPCFVDAVDVGTRLARLLDDPVAVADEPFSLLGSAELRIGETERSYAGIDQRIALSRATANRIVLHQDDPTLCAGVAEPSFVGEPLSGLLALDGRHRVDDKPAGAERLG